MGWKRCQARSDVRRQRHLGWRLGLGRTHRGGRDRLTRERPEGPDEEVGRFGEKMGTTQL